MELLPASGLWGIVYRDGAPVPAQDRSRLALPLRQPDCAVAGRDSTEPHLVDEHADAAGHTILTGWIADPAEFGRKFDLPAAARPAQIARAALHRLGRDLPAEMLGEWSLFHREPDGTVWLMVAATLRDRLFFAARGSRLAFAPSAYTLGALDWIGREPEPEALVLHLGQARLRERLGRRSIFRGIEQMPAGGSAQFMPDGSIRHYRSDALTAQPAFAGSAQDALAALDATLRRVIRDRLSPAGPAAILLSGGLDSSIIAALAAEELESPPVTLCSVAPAGSAAKDERAFAEAVARKAGIRLELVHPLPDANPYLPPTAVLAAAEGQLVSNRHCLTTCFQQVARSLGASTLVGGTYGEMSVTARLRPVKGLRSRLGAVRRIVQDALSPDTARFHVRLAPHRLIRARAPLRDAWHQEDLYRNPLDEAGYMQGTAKALAHPNAYYPGALRMDLPYRDLRLLRLFASMSRGPLQALDPDRGMAREIARDLLPDDVRLRRSGMPADPGHYERLRRFAPDARARIALHRRAQIDDWLDLDWLDQELAKVAVKGVTSVFVANTVQLTALSAEYLQFMRTGQ